MIPKARAVFGFSSTSILTIFKTSSESSSDNLSKIGPCIRHGPHQVAQKSTKTKPSFVSCSNVASVIAFAIVFLLFLVILA
ncbi:Uncharacterised protein [Streptococcus pneumoniae]|nr:Uncharacterised protein [Streptococcus pneumoniae]CJE47893.1 Uncharacterised protein [Streptococcus pneumoniae]CJG23518.1 Uncharacterised protein [Streptococcus pneumoniae]COK53687.1 Uncharacterised protein [Streptococcus pneumoniae]SNM66093.1 Uncharacterised protein [Streptococcus pneumoniae]